jgi:hypothetical protein
MAQLDRVVPCPGDSFHSMPPAERDGPVEPRRHQDKGVLGKPGNRRPPCATSIPPPPRVKAGPVTATQVFVSTAKVVGARAKPGHDTERAQPRLKQHYSIVGSRQARILIPMRLDRAMTCVFPVSLKRLELCVSAPLR